MLPIVQFKIRQIYSDNSSAPNRHHAIIWTNAGLTYVTQQQWSNAAFVMIDILVIMVIKTLFAAIVIIICIIISWFLRILYNCHHIHHQQETYWRIFIYFQVCLYCGPPRESDGMILPWKTHTLQLKMTACRSERQQSATKCLEWLSVTAFMDESSLMLN